MDLIFKDKILVGKHINSLKHTELTLGYIERFVLAVQSADCTELHQWSVAIVIYMQQNQDTMKNVISQYNIRL